MNQYCNVNENPIHCAICKNQDKPKFRSVALHYRRTILVFYSTNCNILRLSRIGKAFSFSVLLHRWHLLCDFVAIDRRKLNIKDTRSNRITRDREKFYQVNLHVRDEVRCSLEFRKAPTPLTFLTNFFFPSPHVLGILSRTFWSFQVFCYHPRTKEKRCSNMIAE